MLPTNYAGHTKLYVVRCYAVYTLFVIWITVYLHKRKQIKYNLPQNKRLSECPQACRKQDFQCKSKSKMIAACNQCTTSLLAKCMANARSTLTPHTSTSISFISIYNVSNVAPLNRKSYIHIYIQTKLIYVCLLFYCCKYDDLVVAKFIVIGVLPFKCCAVVFGLLLLFVINTFVCH